MQDTANIRRRILKFNLSSCSKKQNTDKLYVHFKKNEILFRIKMIRNTKCVGISLKQ